MEEREDDDDGGFEVTPEDSFFFPTTSSRRSRLLSQRAAATMATNDCPSDEFGGNHPSQYAQQQDVERAVMIRSVSSVPSDEEDDDASLGGRLRQAYDDDDENDVESNNKQPQQEEEEKRRVSFQQLPSVWKRMPNTAWGICMGLAGNGNMWNTASATTFLSARINTSIPNYIFWAAAIGAAGIVATAYLYKLLFRFDLVRAEWACPARIHFMNGPHLTLLLITLAIPNEIGASLPTLRIIWTICFVFQTTITQFIYEKWIFVKSQPFRSCVKPQFLLSTVGWFLLAVLGQVAQIEEGWGLALPNFCFGAGTMLYLMVVVALFNESRLEKQSPVLFLLIAPPSVAVVALDLFDDDPTKFSLAASFTLGWCLVVVLLLIRLGPTIAERPPSLGAYWAYVFPLAALATAMLQYATAQQSGAAEVTAVVFLCLAVLALSIVFLRLSIHSCLVMAGREQWLDPLLVNLMKDEDDASGDHRKKEYSGRGSKR